MAARVINAEHATFIGTVQQIAELLGLLRGDGAAIVNVDCANFVVVAKPLAADCLKTAIATTPKRS